MQRAGGDAGLAEFVRGLGGRSKAFDRVAAPLSTFADRLEGAGLSRACQALEGMDAVARNKYLLDGLTLPVIKPEL